jgi:hypothetical protein
MSVCLFYRLSPETFGYTLLWGVEIQLHAFIISDLDGGEWSASRPDRFTPSETAPPPSGSRWIGGWLDLIAGVDAAVTKRKNLYSYKHEMV